MARWNAGWTLRSELLAGLAALSSCQLVGCAKERVYRAEQEVSEEQEEPGASSVPPDEEPIDEPSDEPSTLEPTLQALMTDLFAETLRDISLRCPCFVSEGIDPSLAACMERTKRRPEIDDCLDRTVSGDLLRDLRDWAGCLVDAERAHNACLEAAATCSAQAECRRDSRQCGFPDAVRLRGALEQCPGAIDPAL